MKISLFNLALASAYVFPPDIVDEIGEFIFDLGILTIFQQTMRMESQIKCTNEV